MSDTAQAVDAGQISREGQQIILAQLRQEQRMRELESQIGESSESDTPGHQSKYEAGAYYFHPAHINDIPEIHRLAALVMGEANTFPDNVLLAWIHKNPSTIHVLRRGPEIVGYISLLPLPMNIIELRLAGIIRAQDIPIDAIENFLPGRPLTLYIAETIVNQSKPDRVKIGAKLISEIAEFFLRLAERHIVISEIYTVSTSMFSKRACETLGCEVIDIPGAVRPGRTPFKLDIQKSDSILVAEYKRALAR